jgi:hypothetical protein
MKLVKVKDNADLRRDINSNAIVNVDNIALEQYWTKRNEILAEKEKIKRQEEEINNIKEDVKEIKELLKQLVGDRNAASSK